MLLEDVEDLKARQKGDVSSGIRESCWRINYARSKIVSLNKASNNVVASVNEA